MNKQSMTIIHVFFAKLDFETSSYYFQQRSISIGSKGKVEKLDINSTERALGMSLASKCY